MKNKIIGMLIFILMLLGLSSVVSYGGISANSNTINSGESVTISVTSSEKLGSYTISVTDNGGLTFVSSKANAGGTANGNKISGSSDEGITSLGSFTFKAPEVTKDTTYKVSISSSGTESPDMEPIAESTAVATITVKAPVQEPTQSPDTTPETDSDTEKETQTQTPKEPTFKNVNETVYVQTESVNVRGTWSASGGQYGTLKKGDSVTRTGVSSETINGYVWSRINYNGKTAYVISSALTTTKIEVEEEKTEEEEKSTNKLLKELKVEGYELSPKFDPQTTKYSLTLKEASETEETEDSLEITATPEDEKAKVDITGNEDFKVGNNIVKITVTAEDGTARIYSITVSKTNEEGVVDSLKLSKLEIANATLQPSFDPDVTNYVITIEDPSTITAESIVATAEDKDITITKSETTPDENGEKIITIMLEDKDGKKTGIYQITVKKPATNQAIPTITSSSDNTIYYILGGIIGVLLLLIIIVILALRKTAYNEENIKDANELDDDYDFNLKGAIDEANKPYDDMVEESNFKSQILNTDTVNTKNIDSTNLSEETRVLDDLDKKDYEDFTRNVAPKKKGKHF